MNVTTKRDHWGRLQQQTILARFGEIALKSDNLDKILTEACHVVGQAIGTDLAMILQLQEDGKTLLVRAGVGWKPGIVGEVTLIAEDNTSEGHALKTGKPMISPDITQETRFSYPAFLTDNGVKAIANVTIFGGADRPPFGILQIDSRESRHFTSEDTTFLRSYANLLAAAEERLRVIGEKRNEAARLHLALEAGELGSWDFDLRSYAVVRTSRHDEIFGYSGPSWNAKAFLDHVMPEDRDRVAGTFSHAVLTATELHLECRIRRDSDGEVRWIELHGRPYGELSNTPGKRMLGIVADITARKHAEEKLLRSNVALEAGVAERTRELTEANAKLTVANTRLQAEAEDREQVEKALRQSQKMEAVGQLTGGIAHDFNNLLQGISGSLQLMQSRIVQGRIGELSRYIETAMGSTDRAATLTHRLLAFSRRQTLDPKRTDVNALVGGMEALFRNTISPAIQVQASLAAEPWATLCDPRKLESALLNLVINARDAMPDGGQLLIETTNTVLRDRRGAPKEQPPQDVPPGEYMCLSVVDSGTGMTPDVIARAFDPFFTTKPTGQGTGLGLSMVYGFVLQSGGHVRLRSELGQGTTVAIYLPRHLEAEASVIDGEAASGLPGRATDAVVLVVEDEPDVRLIIVDVVSDLGYSVREAADGRSGLLILETEGRIDLLLTDVGLPGGMNGRQLADAARQRRPDLKVLFVTGYAESVATGDGRMEPGMHVMTKPFSLDVLAAKVQSIIAVEQIRVP